MYIYIYMYIHIHTYMRSYNVAGPAPLFRFGASEFLWVAVAGPGFQCVGASAPGPSQRFPLKSALQICRIYHTDTRKYLYVHICIYIYMYVVDIQIKL